MKLFDRPKARKAIDIVLWWEIRRLLYNVIMIGVGLSSFFIVGFVTIPIVYMMIGVSLNILYTVSWLMELIFIRPYNSQKLTSNYVRFFMIGFYIYSVLGVLAFMSFPRLLSWTFFIYGW